MTHPDHARSPELLRLWPAFALLPLITAALAFLAVPFVWASGAIFWVIGLRETDDRPTSLLR